MAAIFSSALKRSKTFLTTGSIHPSAPKSTLSPDSSFTQAPEATSLFPTVTPEIDGEDCDHDCESCEVKYPKGWKIEEDDQLYGHVNGWETHMLVATGKTDWVKDVADVGGSVMEAVGKWKRQVDGEPSNGKLMLSASNIPLPPESREIENSNPQEKPTTILLLPAFTIIDGVTPSNVPELIEQVIATAPTNITPLNPTKPVPANILPASTSSSTSPPKADELNGNGHSTPPTTTLPLTPSSKFSPRPIPHKALILLCSQKTRDARCGQSAPLLRRELERHLRTYNLYRDAHDERPGGVGVYFISHVGGHKYSANMMVYRRTGVGGELGKGGEASQCIWLARVRPEDCEGIVKFTVLQGKVVKPARQLRGGFDRERGVVSW